MEFCNALDYKLFALCDFVGEDFHVVVETLSEFYDHALCLAVVIKEYIPFVAALEFLYGVVGSHKRLLVAEFEGCVYVHTRAEFLRSIGNLELYGECVGPLVNGGIHNLNSSREYFVAVCVGLYVDFHANFHFRHVGLRHLHEGFEGGDFHEFIYSLTREEFARLVVACRDDTRKRCAEIGVLFEVFERRLQYFEPRLGLVEGLLGDVVGVVEDFDAVEVLLGVFIVEFCGEILGLVHLRQHLSLRNSVANLHVEVCDAALERGSHRHLLVWLQYRRECEDAHDFLFFEFLSGYGLHFFLLGLGGFCRGAAGWQQRVCSRRQNYRIVFYFCHFIMCFYKLL